MEHRGEIIEKEIRESGIPLTTIAKRMGKTRQWLYLLFENPNVSIDHMLEIGKIIYHDFSKNIPELKLNGVSEGKQEAFYDTKSEVQLWKDKYFTLLEEHNALLKQFLTLKVK
jgi:hypothetical protein